MIVMFARKPKNGVQYTLVIIAVLCYGGCIASSNEYSEIRERLITISNKVDAIDAKLNSRQSNQDLLSLLTRIDRRLDSIDSKLDGSAPQSGILTTEASVKNEEEPPENSFGTTGEQEDYPYQTCVDLISVERTPADEGNIFVVKFTKNTPDVYVRYQDQMGPEKSVDSMMQGEDGIWSVSFFSKITEEDRRSPWIAFRDIVDDEEKSIISTRHALYLNLNNSVLSHSVQSLGTIPELHVEPPRQVVYTPGQDFNVTAFAPLGNVTWDYPNIFYVFNGINITSGEALMIAREEAFREIETDSEDKDKIEKTITVLTSNSTLSGYLSFGFGIDVEGPIVKRVQVNRVIMVRPSNQSTVVPSGFLDIFDNPHKERSVNGHEMSRCGSDKECLTSCYAVGDSITDLTVFKVSPDGSRIPVSSAFSPNLSVGGEAIKAVFWKFQSTQREILDGDGITTFECVATDETRGKTVTKMVDVLVMLPDGLDETESNVTVADDRMDPNIKHLTFSCAVFGRPLPEVTFHGGSSQIFSLEHSDPDDVITTGPNRAVYTKNLTINVDYFRDHNYEYYSDDHPPSCDLYSYSQGYLRHNFEVPDIGLFAHDQ